MSGDVSSWSCEDVKEWLEERGFSQYVQLLCDQHEVDGEVLLTLTEEDLKLPPLEIITLSHVKKLYNCIKQLQKENGVYNSNVNVSYQRRLPRNFYKKPSCTAHMQPQTATFSESDEIDSDIENHGKKFLPDYFKLFISFVYAFIASWITAFVMVLVHEKVPDMTKYPPLPDIFLDNVPLIPYAFKLAEMCGLCLCIIWMIILLLHKHRYILLRRFFSITSTVFLLRSVTMFVTSLSVPGKHLECQAMYHDGLKGRMMRATHIVSGLGMSLTGVQTCGDYMFSGHTAYLTLFNHFITEYTSSKFHYLHTLSWVLNLFGIFFVLAAHEHYSIDVFIAFYITSRIFVYYHMLANTLSYWRSRRIRYLFPMFSFFECNVPGKVPNESDFSTHAVFLPWNYLRHHHGGSSSSNTTTKTKTISKQNNSNTQQQPSTRFGERHVEQIDKKVS